ncbi:hypothetical protein HID58_083223 [Brassica napus]|uniref:GPI mannosyltransferase 1 n=1 Tax=Brassica napus TaxID=3708 RepID=A0ABQ7YCX3_BRANA|nr:hypothetical protein HID58_083223 [Brassica napus]
MGTKLMTFRSLLVSSLHATENGKTLTWRSATRTSTTPSSPTMASGESPYKRTTYRYSPLLALLLVPNSIIHRSWGKFIFSASALSSLKGSTFHNLFVVICLLDLLVGLFIREILKLRKVVCTVSLMVWLLNPFTFTIGTRGNCEPIVCAMILWIIFSLMKGNLSQAAFWYGLGVHFRVYPVIYALPIILSSIPSYLDLVQSRLSRIGIHILAALRRKHSTSVERIMFGLISGGVFLACNAVSFYFYGHEFLHEALLYHLTRTDPRHNFSIYFYHIYLHYERQFSAVEKLISFLPQFTVQLALVFSFSKDPVFCMFLQTVAFVAFNKVITAQYFVWFYCLLPLILPWSRMKMKWQGLLCIVLWIGAQTHWLLWGYMLEFKGVNVFLQLWMASLVMGPLIERMLRNLTDTVPKAVCFFVCWVVSYIEDLGTMAWNQT